MELQPFVRVLGVPWFYTERKLKPVLKIEPVKPTRNSKALDWTAEQDERIRQEYPATDTNALALSLGMTAKQVRSRARQLGVSKDRDFFRKQQRRNSLKYGWEKL